MTRSLPSREIYAVDVPEVTDFSAKFRYNFYTPDESINDTGDVPLSVLKKNSAFTDSDFVQYSVKRTPRFVEFRFTPVIVSDIGRQVSDGDVKENAFKAKRTDTLIRDNYDKIVTEDQFSSFSFLSVNFQDAEIDSKVHYLVSGTFEQHRLTNNFNDNASYAMAGAQVQAVVPNHIKSTLISYGMTNSLYAYGARYFVDEAGRGRIKQSNIAATRHKEIRNSLTREARSDKAQVMNKHTLRMAHVNISAQLNGKLIGDIVNRAIDDPNANFAEDMYDLQQIANSVQNKARAKASPLVDDSDFKTNVPFIDVRVNRAANQGPRKGAEIVGYIIDKEEILDGERVVQHEPVIVENPNASLALDFSVKYGTAYTYSVRAVSRITLPAIDSDTGDLAMLQILVSSKPSTRLKVETIEQEAPPPPADVNFTWNYETEKLMVHWTFPTNSQRDIKKFQVFRRKTVNHPFEMLKMYDFDDSLVRYENNETPDPALTEYLKNPVTFYIDDDFTKDSTYIYSIASVDAHGFTSAYSAQFELSFDRFKNRLVKRFISHSGAPKPYPNLYLEADTFVDTIKVAGASTKQMKVYFNPEYYSIIDDDLNIQPMIATVQRGGKYVLQFINLDNQKSDSLQILVQDKISSDKYVQIDTALSRTRMVREEARRQ